MQTVQLHGHSRGFANFNLLSPSKPKKSTRSKAQKANLAEMSSSWQRDLAKSLMELVQHVGEIEAAESGKRLTLCRPTTICSCGR